MTAPYSIDLRERAMARKAAGETNCGIRDKAATDSDGKRPLNPIEGDHLIRTKAATLLMG